MQILAYILNPLLIMRLRVTAALRLLKPRSVSNYGETFNTCTSKRTQLLPGTFCAGIPGRP